MGTFVLEKMESDKWKKMKVDGRREVEVNFYLKTLSLETLLVGQVKGYVEHTLHWDYSVLI